MFDVDEDFLLPKAPGDLITGDDLSVFGDQEDQEFEGLALELEPAVLSGELKFVAMQSFGVI